MASAQESAKLTSTLKLDAFDFDPDSAAVQDVGFVDLQNFSHFLVQFARTVGTGNLDTFKILANSEADGSGTDVEVKVKTITSQPNAQADTVYLECTAEEVGALSTSSNRLRYVSAALEFATSTDEAAVTYIREAGRFANKDLTADTIA